MQQQDDTTRSNDSTLGQQNQLQSKGFIEFCDKNGISHDMYQKAKTIPRFIRFKPGSESELDVHKFEQSLTHQSANGTEEPPVKKQKMVNIRPVSWLPEQFMFYSMDSDTNIAYSTYYKKGLIYGLDISSAMAVFALHPQPNDKILDMCCAPGAKLCLLADYISQSSGSNQFYITGVDVNIDRLNKCKNILKKYKVDNVRLVLADGTKFCQTEKRAPLRLEGRKAKRQINKWMKMQSEQSKTESCSSLVLPEEISDAGVIFHETKGSFQTLRIQQEMQKSKENSTATTVTILNDSEEYFDKIIVDAECSTDGSVKHIIKMVEEGWDKYHNKYFNEERMKEITTLQLALLKNAFRILKPGGVLVYSTCSFTREQNEGIIEAFLKDCKQQARLVPPFENTLVTSKVPYREGFLTNTVRFDPVSSGTSGLFIAKLVKPHTS